MERLGSPSHGIVRLGGGATADGDGEDGISAAVPATTGVDVQSSGGSDRDPVAVV